MGARTKIITLALYGDIVTVLSINLKYSSSYQSSFDVCPWFVTAWVRSQKECLSISPREKKIAKKCTNEKERIDFIIDLSNTLQVIIVAREAVSIT